MRPDPVQARARPRRRDLPNHRRVPEPRTAFSRGGGACPLNAAVALTGGALQCQSCGASLQLAAGARTATCPYCASPSVVERPASADRPNPAFVVAFVIPRDQALALARAWVRSKSGIFTHSGLRKATIDDVRGVYVPAYLYGAIAHSEYAASIGEDYTETVMVAASNGRGGTRVRPQQRRRTEWRPLSGRYAAYVRDIVVTASRGIPNHDLERIEPFDLRALHRYTPMAISGWLAEEPSLALPVCLDMARAEANQQVGRMLARFMPGDRHRDLRHSTSFEHESLELVLVPVWVLALRYDPQKPPLRVLVNGQTGRAFGRAPISWIKVTVAIVLAVIVVGAIALYAYVTEGT